MDLREVQEKQREYDAEYWEHGNSRLENLTHIGYHIDKLAGKVATFCERRDHGIDFPDTQLKGEVVPDLQIYSAQLANEFRFDLKEGYFEGDLNRLQEMVGDYSSEELESVKELLIDVKEISRMLAKYLSKLKNGAFDIEEGMLLATKYLQCCTARAANSFNVNLEEAYPVRQAETAGKIKKLRGLQN